jgi:hypothetical protein
MMINGCAWSGGGLPENKPAMRSGKLQWARVGSGMFVLLITACLALRTFSGHPGSQLGDPLSASSSSLTTPSKPDAKSILGHLPLIFEPNQGQADSHVKFVAHGQGYSLYLDETGAVLSLRAAPSAGLSAKSKDDFTSVKMKLVGGNPDAELIGSGPLPGASNYFIGNHPKQWHTGVRHFAGVQYRSVYPGIDLVFYGSQGRLEYDFNVAPGADPSRAELQFDGAGKLELRDGDVILKGTEASVRSSHISADCGQTATGGRAVCSARRQSRGV